MADGMEKKPSLTVDRRGFVKFAGAAAAAVGAPAAASVGTSAAAAAQSAETMRAAPQPAMSPSSDKNTSDILVDTLITWGATHVFGIVGDGINPIVEALRKRQDKIAFVSVRHEEAAAFMAGGMAKHGGRLGVCLATTGPGAAHLMNGLYDAAYDNAPVVAITGTTFHDMEGMRFMQSVDTVKLMQDVALLDERITGPDNALMLVNRACRTALANRGVVHLTIAKDVQQLTLAADKASSASAGGRTASSWAPPMGTPPVDQLRAAAEAINAGRRIAIMAGQGCAGAVPQLRKLADTLGAPIAKAYLAKALMPDDDPLTTGGVGHLGTAPSQWAMENCDTVLILGTTMPWVDSYPKPGQARGVQIDIKADHIGLKYPVEVGLTGDMGATLDALLPMLQAKTDRSFLTEAQTHKRTWRTLLDQVEATQKGPRLRPQTAVRVLSDLAPANALFSMDCGANTHFAARHIQIRQGQGWTGSGTLVTMASALPLAIAGAFAHPGRTSIALAGDGGLSMLMAELSTAVVNQLDVKVMVLNNDAYGQVKAEQRELGVPEYGCALGHIDFAACAEGMGARGFRAASVAELRPAVQAWLAASGPAVLDVEVDPEEESQRPNKVVA
ncbi:thiamine pyrophosphate-dependent enzyme [Methylobacterium sp. E-016]|uniref:thiamine pyrophosphate-binding protein n=1 Tax=Methylobacterium sp. E-016 TaxID=2836556 RepID=UPI001FBB4B49|nr:thiamine pyrophosphate-dependent enzyme [Methylobacterium sp. E-016]MCJ2074737.1 thiamine pyrophosphate-dependent enzyme [Methylobacterium sp. E-016]